MITLFLILFFSELNINNNKPIIIDNDTNEVKYNNGSMKNKRVKEKGARTKRLKIKITTITLKDR